MREAKIYTSQQQLWVYEDAPSQEITCIVAVTRTSTGVAAITKVYTDHHWRGKGCAVKLVRHVTDQWVLLVDLSWNSRLTVVLFAFPQAFEYCWYATRGALRRAQQRSCVESVSPRRI